MNIIEGLRYNYVILGSSWDLYKQSYSDVIENSNVRYITDDVIKKLIARNPLYHFQFSKINNYLSLPLKGIWNSCYFQNDFNDDKPICFILFERWARLNHTTGFTSYLRKKYKGCKIIFFLQDLFVKQKKDFSNQPFDVDEEKEYYDLIVSFDQNECNQFGFDYHSLVFSDYKGKIEDMPISDIYFLGQAKDRLKEIIKAYEILNDIGLNVDMYLTGVATKDQVYSDKIKYIKSMPYQENIQHVLHSKCLLEIMQKNGHGYTQRVVEAVVLNKKILTNNPEIEKAPFYNSNYISQFASVNELDFEFLMNLKKNSQVEYSYKEKLSPVSFLRYIDKKIQ